MMAKAIHRVRRIPRRSSHMRDRLPSIRAMKAALTERIPLNTRYLLGFELRVPVDHGAMNLKPYERDKWAVDQLKAHGLKPLSVTHFRRVYEGDQLVALMIMSYVYKKQQQ